METKNKKEYYWLVWDTYAKKERIITFSKNPQLVVDMNNDGTFTVRTGLAATKVVMQFIREADKDEMSETGIKNSIKGCLSGNCAECSMPEKGITDPEDCIKNLLNNALNYILRLEEHDERRK